MPFLKARSAVLSQYITVKDLFVSLPKEVLKEMLLLTSREFIAGGDTLFEQGDEGKDLYIVAAGRLKYEKYNLDGKIDEGEFQKMDILGELSVFTGEPRSATVLALRDSELIRIPKELALSVLTKYPAALLQITSVIAERLALSRRKTKKKSLKVKNFAILPTSSSFSIEPFLQVLVETLQKFGTVGLVRDSDYKQVLDQFENDTERDHQIVHWFQALEAHNNFLIFVCGTEWNEWEATCIRQTDRFLIVQDVQKNVSRSRLEKELEARKINKPMDLVLIQRDYPKLPENTIHHLEIRNISQHYHIHLNSIQTLERMARGILGKSIGVAFGGGGAKGFAHLGVMEAFEVAGIPVDQVAGTSAGSIFGALLALGYSAEDAKKEAKSFWVDRDLLNEFTVPVLALVTGKKYTEAIRSFFKDIQIEDLWIPFYAFSTNLTSSSEKVHDRGSLWKAIRCSTSLPGIVPPFVENGEIFIDGGVLDNVPGLLLQERGVGYLVSIDVYGDHPPEKDKSFQNYYEFGQPGVVANPVVQLGNLINFPNILEPKFPPIGEVIIRAILVSGRQKVLQTKEASDLYLKIPTNQYGVMEWSSYAKLVELGYKESIRHVQDFARYAISP